MDYVVLLVFTGALAVGVVGAVVRTWSLHSRLYSLEDRVGVLEGVQTREVKIRAAQSRQPKNNADDALVEQLRTVGSGRKKNWWEVNPAVKNG